MDWIAELFVACVFLYVLIGIKDTLKEISTKLDAISENTSNLDDIQFTLESTCKNTKP